MDRVKALKAATTLLEYVGSIDPTWASRIKVTKDEFRYDDLQVAGAYIAQVLEAGAHTVIPRNSFFDPGALSPDTTPVCPYCHKEYVPAYPGQPFDSNECAIRYRANVLRVSDLR